MLAGLERFVGRVEGMEARETHKTLKSDRPTY